MNLPVFPTLAVILPLLEIGVIVRILLRAHRDPASRIAWVVVVAFVPIVGILAYLFFGEVRAGTRGRARSEVASAKSVVASASLAIEAVVPERHRNLFHLGASINGNPPVTGNRASLLADSNAAIDAMVTDIDAARDSVHVDFYIWLPDNNGRKIVEALKRAGSRGIVCRALADDLGSRALIRSEHWAAMRAAGVQVANSMPIGNPLLMPFNGRIDVRNHRKIVVIDDRVTYCGSQNCADPEFLPKAKYAPWVDIMIRLEGPIVAQNQGLFVSDWAMRTDEQLAVASTPVSEGGEMAALVIGTGPTVRYSAISEMFESLFFAARREIVISTPYYAPDEAMHNAICTCAYRGVETTMIVPARNDSWMVGAASRSYYADLVAAGVRLFEFNGGLLHAKTVTVDREVSLIGSANMDRRSFELNFENNILISDSGLSQAIRARQDAYLKSSHAVTKEMVAAWPLPIQLWHNAVATLGPLI
jgi:cardiolipin synthase